MRPQATNVLAITRDVHRFCFGPAGALEFINEYSGHAVGAAPIFASQNSGTHVPPSLTDPSPAAPPAPPAPLSELLRTGAGELVYQAVQAELEELLAEHSQRRLSDGKAGVVRNGYLPAREIQTGLGPVTVRIPKVRAKTGEAVTFRSALVPPYVRKTKSLEAALPWLYLKGISSGEMGGSSTPSRPANSTTLLLLIVAYLQWLL